MKPSTKLLVGAGVAVAGVLAFLIVVLPRIGRAVDRAATGLEPHEGARFTTWASSKDRARERGEFAEAFVRDFLARWGSSRGFVDPPRRIRVFLFDDHKGLTEYGLLKHGEALENNGGYFSADEEAIALVRGDDASLRHELTHLLVSVSWGKGAASPWFNEGLAQWHEGGVEGSLSAGVSRRVAEWIADGSLVPLNRILDAKPEDFRSASNAYFYFESATLVAWLAKERPEALERVITSERTAAASRKRAFEAAVGVGLADVEKSWREWVLGEAR